MGGLAETSWLVLFCRGTAVRRGKTGELLNGIDDHREALLESGWLGNASDKLQEFIRFQRLLKHSPDPKLARVHDNVG